MSKLVTVYIKNKVPVSNKLTKQIEPIPSIGIHKPLRLNSVVRITEEQLEFLQRMYGQLYDFIQCDYSVAYKRKRNRRKRNR